MINKSHKIEYKKLYNKLKSHPINQWIIGKGWQWFPHQIQILKSIEKKRDPTKTTSTKCEALFIKLNIGENKII